MVWFFFYKKNSGYLELKITWTFGKVRDKSLVQVVNLYKEHISLSNSLFIKYLYANLNYDNLLLSQFLPVKPTSHLQK